MTKKAIETMVKDQNLTTEINSENNEAKKNLALKPLSSNITIEELKKVLKVPDYHNEPDYLFSILIETKRICTREHLKEMFKLGDVELRHVIYEGRRSYDRCFYTEPEASDILTEDRLWDNNSQAWIPIELTPAQEKLRALLTKFIKSDRLDSIIEEATEEYGLCFDAERVITVSEWLKISEEELLDALNTYQAEHQA